MNMSNPKIKIINCYLGLAYPGSMSFNKNEVGDMLIEGRQKLIKEYKAKRYKIGTEDGNVIDSIFVDKRDSSFPR